VREPRLLDTIFAPGQIGVLFQPIFEVQNGRRTLHSVESLTRGPVGTNMHAAGVLFEYVRRKGKEAAMDRLCVATALREAARLPPEVPLSINVHASTLERDPEFPPFLRGIAEARSIPLTRVVLEIVEHAPAYGGPRFLKALDLLRDAGVRIALDDIGLGQSNFRMIIESHPDYFKIDAFLVQGCHRDTARQAVLDSLVQLARKFGSRVVAEGVEHAADFLTLGLLDIDLVQGYLFSKALPAAEIAEVHSEAGNSIR
jgi:EAL domain-containing protein (putative c-di-GMP-specific phosphodiesterase class I)